MKLIEEFKNFALKGNVLDMAIGIIIGAAFGKTVSSLADDILTPFLNILISNIHFTDLQLLLNDPLLHGQKITVNYGVFIQNTISFLIISFSVFLLIKSFHILKKKEEVKKEEKKSEELLLSEIRDLLKENLALQMGEAPMRVNNKRRARRRILNTGR